MNYILLDSLTQCGSSGMLETKPLCDVSSAPNAKTKGPLQVISSLLQLRAILTVKLLRNSILLTCVFFKFLSVLKSCSFDVCLEKVA